LNEEERERQGESTYDRNIDLPASVSPRSKIVASRGSAMLTLFLTKPYTLNEKSSAMLKESKKR